MTIYDIIPQTVGKRALSVTALNVRELNSVLLTLSTQLDSYCSIGSRNSTGWPPVNGYPEV